jgi:lycopene cyclase domain-containing protein
MGKPMSYTLFLIVFVCVPLGLLVWRLRHRLWRIDLVLLVGLAVIAVVYTTPWDNYLVATGVWYYDPRLVLNLTIGYVPVEEYAFFILQAFLTGLFGMWLWDRFYRREHRQDGR